MPAPPVLDDIRFVFDEDSCGFGLWLAKLRKDTTCVGAAPVEKMLPLGILDPDWIPVVAEHRFAPGVQSPSSPSSPAPRGSPSTATGPWPASSNQAQHRAHNAAGSDNSTGEFMWEDK